MMSKATPRAFAPLLLACCALPLATLAQEMHPCAMVAEPAQRLACYDKAFPPSPAVHEAATEKAKSNFGLEKPAEPLLNPGQTREDSGPEKIESRVARVEYGRGGGRTIMLENGQVWALTEGTGRGPTAEGDVVTVRKGLMGSDLLFTSAGVGLRVRRVR